MVFRSPWFLCVVAPFVLAEELRNDSNCYDFGRQASIFTILIVRNPVSVQTVKYIT
jgi:hypothetical protein